MAMHAAHISANRRLGDDGVMADRMLVGIGVILIFTVYVAGSLSWY